MYPSENNQPSHTPAPAYQPPSSSPSSPVTPQQPIGEDPGKTLAIVGIILAFFFSIIGLIVSIVARGKSRNAGHPATLATVGIVLNSVFILLGTVILGILTAITIVAYNGIQERARETEYRAQEQNARSQSEQNKDSTRSAANVILKNAMAYQALDGTYPTSLAQFSKYQESSLDESTIELISSVDITDSSNTVQVYFCNGSDVVTAYWDNELAGILYQSVLNISLSPTLKDFDSTQLARCTLQ